MSDALLLAIVLILLGIRFLLPVASRAYDAVLGVVALVAGILLLV